MTYETGPELNYMDGLEAGRREAMAAPDWQPIETAPKDQRSILAVNANSQIQQVCWRAADKGDLWDVRYGGEWKPTHWMPLPAPPRQQGGEP